MDVTAEISSREKSLYSIYREDGGQEDLVFGGHATCSASAWWCRTWRSATSRSGALHSTLQAQHQPVQGLHRHPQGQRLPVTAHDGGRAPTAAASNSRSARRRCTIWPKPGVAAHWLYKADGRNSQRAADQDARLAQVAAGHPAADRRLAGVHRSRQGRPLSRRGLRVHAEGPDPWTAARGDRDRLRLQRPHRCRQPVRGRAHQRRPGAVAHRT